MLNLDLLWEGGGDAFSLKQLLFSLGSSLLRLETYVLRSVLAFCS